MSYGLRHKKRSMDVTPTPRSSPSTVASSSSSSSCLGAAPKRQNVDSDSTDSVPLAWRTDVDCYIAEPTSALILVCVAGVAHSTSFGCVPRSLLPTERLRIMFDRVMRSTDTVFNIENDAALTELSFFAVALDGKRRMLLCQDTLDDVYANSAFIIGDDDNAPPPNLYITNFRGLKHQQKFYELLIEAHPGTASTFDCPFDSVSGNCYSRLPLPHPHLKIERVLMLNGWEDERKNAPITKFHCLQSHTPKYTGPLSRSVLVLYPFEGTSSCEYTQGGFRVIQEHKVPAELHDKFDQLCKGSITDYEDLTTSLVRCGFFSDPSVNSERQNADLADNYEIPAYCETHKKEFHADMDLYKKWRETLYGCTGDAIATIPALDRLWMVLGSLPQDAQWTRSAQDCHFPCTEELVNGEWRSSALQDSLHIPPIAAVYQSVFPGRIRILPVMQ